MRRPLHPVKTYLDGIRAADRVLLGQAITLIESARPEHQEVAEAIIAELMAGQRMEAALRVGITGVPGVGKSTFIEALGMHLLAEGHRLAVLAIDPSSSVTRGSIMGDKTRMERLSMAEGAFIRPSPTGDTLGGVARKTRETMILLEAAGCDVVLVETVGVGQSEVAVRRMTDLLLLLLLPGAGDELQGIKRGIVEMADILAVNKAEGAQAGLANQARLHYLHATHLLPLKPSGWTPPVALCSAQEGTGIRELWDLAEAYRRQTLANGFFAENRRQQAQLWFQEALEQGLQTAFFSHPVVQNRLTALEAEVLAGRISPFAAAKNVLLTFLKNKE